MLPAVAYTLEVPKALHGLSCACPLSQFLLMDLCTSQHDIGESSLVVPRKTKLMGLPERRQHRVDGCGRSNLY